NKHPLINIVMKKISLILFIIGMIWTVQTAQAQTQDTTKNSIEVKKTVRKGAHGRTITKIKMTGKGTADAINGAADDAVTGHSKPVVINTPAPVQPQPTVVVVHDTVRTNTPVPVYIPAPEPKTTEVTTTTTETKPVVTAGVNTHHATHAYHKPGHTYHRTYKKTAATTPATKTTTTTTVKKTE
ncbi:MAG: hypothetical protein ACHQIM_10630, partial [Sphingobacteriales bacterium]